MPDTSEFVPYPKTPRFFRDVTITEKIDGTNGQVFITDRPVIGVTPVAQLAREGELPALVYAGSRNRWVHPGAEDNFGFAAWVASHAGSLTTDLGLGRHFGEWYGYGIQKNPYGLGKGERRFALLNPYRPDPKPFETNGLDVVPILAECNMSDIHVVLREALNNLRAYGSTLSPAEFGYAEGVIIYHHAARTSFKVTLRNDDRPKGTNA